MRKSMLCASLIVVSTYASVAASQDYPGQNPPAPKAHTGFQLGLRTGVALPFGKARGGAYGTSTTSGVDLSEVASPQVPIYVEIGGKPIPNLFIGGYLGLGFGGAGDQTDIDCNNTNTTCVVVDARFGIEVQYHILPDAWVNPWVGYGFGFESVALSASNGDVTSSGSFSGFEFAHFMTGVDFRLSRVFGLGPFVGFSLGQYSRVHLEVNNTSRSEDIPETAMHQWLTVGLRTVFFP
jgi:hypothetical protein